MLVRRRQLYNKPRGMLSTEIGHPLPINPPGVGSEVPTLAHMRLY